MNFNLFSSLYQGAKGIGQVADKISQVQTGRSISEQAPIQAVKNNIVAPIQKEYKKNIAPVVEKQIQPFQQAAEVAKQAVAPIAGMYQGAKKDIVRGVGISNKMADLNNEVKSAGITAEDIYNMAVEDGVDPAQTFNEMKSLGINIEGMEAYLPQEQVQQQTNQIQNTPQDSYPDQFKMKSSEKFGVGETFKDIGKFFVNVPADSAEVVGGIWDAVSHPVDTAGGLFKTGMGLSDKAVYGVLNSISSSLGGKTVKPTEEAKMIDMMATNIKEQYGTPGKFKKALVENPADTLLTFMGGLGMVSKFAKANGYTNIANNIEKAQQVINPVNIIKQESKIVTKPLGFMGKKVIPELLGKTTGTSAETIRTATRLGATPEFQGALKGEITPKDILAKTKEGMSAIRENRSALYGEDYKKVQAIKTQVPIDDVLENVKNTLQNDYKVQFTDNGIDFSQSKITGTTSQSQIQNIVDDIANWKDKTPEGLDVLKQRIQDYFRGVEDSGKGDRISTIASNAIKDKIVSQVPEYANMTKTYEKITNDIRDITKTLSLGDKVSPQTAMTKLNGVLRENFSARQDMIKIIEQYSGKNLQGMIAGASLNPFASRGLMGVVGGAGVAFGQLANPVFLAGLTLASPRLIGELAKTIGVTTEKVNNFITNIKKYVGSSNVAPSELPNSGIVRTEQVTRPIITPTRSPQAPRIVKNLREDTKVNPNVLAGGKGVIVKPKVVQETKLLPSGDRLRQSEIKNIRDELNTALNSKYNPNKPEATKKLLESKIAQGKMTEPEAIKMVEDLKNNANGFDKPHYERIIKEGFGKDTFESLLSEKGPIIKKPTGAKIVQGADDMTPKQLYTRLDKMANDNRVGEKIWQEMADLFKKKTGKDPMKVGYPEWNPDGSMKTTVTSQTTATGPRVLGSMGKMKTKEVPQSLRAFEDGSRQPYTIGIKKPIIKNAPEKVVEAPKVEKSLIEEAKKYKSAEEFVNSHLLHGSPGKIEGGELRYGMKKGQDSGGIFLTDTPEVANTFTFGKGEVSYIDPKLKNEVIDLTTKEGKNIIKGNIGKKYETMDGDIITFTKDDFDMMFPNGETDFASVAMYQEFIQNIVKENGKKGIAFGEYAGGKHGKTYQIIEGNVPVKTKQQLQEIYAQAHSKPTIKNIDTSFGKYNSGKLQHKNGSLDYEIVGNTMDIDMIKVTDKQKGIGTELMKEAERIAKEKLLSKIQLSAQPVDESISKSALSSFYKKNGYTNKGNDIFIKELKPTIKKPIIKNAPEKVVEAPKVEKSLTPEEKDMILEYTFVGGGKGKPMPIAQQKKVSEYIKKLPENTEEVYSGIQVSNDMYSDLNFGSFETKRLLSTSKDRNVAREYMYPSGKMKDGMNPVILKIKGGGYDIDALSHYGKGKAFNAEQEVLFPAGTKFDVVKIREGEFELTPIKQKPTIKKPIIKK